MKRETRIFIMALVAYLVIEEPKLVDEMLQITAKAMKNFHDKKVSKT